MDGMMFLLAIGVIVASVNLGRYVIRSLSKVPETIPWATGTDLLSDIQ